VKLRFKVLVGALGFAGVMVLVSKFVVSLYLVDGQSMTPTLRHMELCLTRVTRPYRPQRGDIVVFRTADDPPLYFVKRVLALPGETIAIRRGVVEIDGAPLPDQYVPVNPEWELPPTPVPADKVYVIGDNRTVAFDETVHGLVAVRLVKARLIAHWRWKR
jgi:signal peptidase I